MEININEPLIIDWYTDDSGSKILLERLNQSYKIMNNQISILEVLDEYNKVQIDNMIELKSYEEIKNENEYKVFFPTGVIKFHPNKDGQTVNIKRYYSKGLFRISAEHIYTRQDANGNIIQTLQDIINGYTSAVNGNGAKIDDENTSLDSTWSSNKIITEQNNKIGNLSALNTTQKGNIVNSINEVSGQLNDKTTIVDVTYVGMKYDGVSDCTPFITDLVNACKIGERQAKIMHFKQNGGGNATYYFSNANAMTGGGKFISCEQDVKWKVNTINGQSINIINVGLYPLSIYVVDRNNTITVYPNLSDDDLYTTALLSSDDSYVGVKKLTYLDNTKLTKTDYFLTNTPSSAGSALWDSTQKMFKGNTGTTNLNQFVITEYSIGSNNYFYGSFKMYQPDIADNNVDTRYGVSAIVDGDNFVMCCVDTQGNYIRNVKTSGVNVVTTKALGLNDAYRAKYGCVLSIFIDSPTKAKIYVNGALVDEFEYTSAFNKVGFGINQNNVAGSGVNKHYWGNIVCGFADRVQATKPLKIIAFGDSLTQAEGVESWVNILKKRLTGSNGFSDIQITNKAISGQTSAQQLTVMQGTSNLNTYDACLILVGTNDIQGLIDPLNITESNIRTMVQLAKSNGCKVVVGIPPMFISQSLTGTGFATANYEKGSEIRGRILKVIAEEGAYLADTMSELGFIDVSTYSKLLRDNLHLTQLTSIMLAKCFARTLIEISNGLRKAANTTTVSYTNTSYTALTLQNGWGNLGSGYESAEVYKDGSGVVHVNGLITGGTYTNGTIIAPLPSGYSAPTTKKIFTCQCNNGTIGIEVSGGGLSVSIPPGSAPSWVSLCGITFRTD